MTRQPLVSVCIPAFNARQFIAATIESVLAQTLTDFELIVIDDASSDGTAELVGAFRDSRIKLHRHTENAGLAANWNRAIAACRGRCVKLLCQDDVLYPHCLARETEAIADPENADVALVCCRRDVIDSAGKTVLRGSSRVAPSGKITGSDARRRIVRSGTNPIGEPVAVLLRSEVIARTGQFSDASPYMIDVDYWARALRNGSMIRIPETLCAFRISRSSLSYKLAGQQGRDARQFLHRLAHETPGEISVADLLLGQAKATLLAPIRRLAYQFLRR